MRVALINNFPHYSGTGRVAYSLSNEFKKTPKIKCDLICTHAMTRKDLKDPINREVKFLHSFPYKEHEYLSRFLIYFVDPHRISGYDVYHLTNHMLGRFARFLKPAVVTAHDVLQFKYREDMGNPLVSWVYNKMMDESIKGLKKAARVICVSESSRREVIKILGLDPLRVKTIYNGLDHRLFRQLDKTECRRKLKLPLDKKMILHVGAELPRKNIKGLFKAFALVKKKESDLLLIRVGEQKPQSKKLIESLGLFKDILYFNYLSEEDLVCVYNAADVLSLPSFDEGFGFPVLEALACGCPVVCSNTSSLPEVGGNVALYVNPRDEKDIADKVLEVLHFNTAQYHSRMEKGLRWAKKFTWEKTAKETLGVYQEVVREFKIYNF